MDELLMKFGLLDSLKRQEILDFIDFLLNKQEKGRILNFKSYKEQILQVSTWSEEDIKVIETVKGKLQNNSNGLMG